MTPTFNFLLKLSIATVLIAWILYNINPMSTTLSTMPPKSKLNVHTFPRPPLLEKTPRHLQVKWKDQTIADTKEAYWVLETTHPPSNHPHYTSLYPSLLFPPTLPAITADGCPSILPPPHLPHHPPLPLHALLLLRMERQSYILEHQIARW